MSLFFFSFVEAIDCFKIWKGGKVIYRLIIFCPTEISLPISLHLCSRLISSFLRGIYPARLLSQLLCSLHSALCDLLQVLDSLFSSLQVLSFSFPCMVKTNHNIIFYFLTSCPSDLPLYWTHQIPWCLPFLPSVMAIVQHLSWNHSIILWLGLEGLKVIWFKCSAVGRDTMVFVEVRCVLMAAVYHR